MEVALQLTDNASLRGLEGEDGKWYFSVYDFINFVTGHEPGHDYAYQTFKRLVKPGSEHANEVASNCSYFQFPCQGQKSTPCMTTWPSAPPHDPYHDPCHEPGHDYAYQTFKRLVKPGSEHAEAVRSLCSDCQFPGERQNRHHA